MNLDCSVFVEENEGDVGLPSVAMLIIIVVNIIVSIAGHET
jgi:hypothetical protein